MALTASQNWDGVTPPAIPAGWNVDSALATSSSQSYSASNSLNLSGGSSGTRYWGTYATGDGSGSDPVVVAAAIKLKFTNSGLTLDYTGGLAWRGSGDTLDGSTTSQYVAFGLTNLVTEVDKLVFAKVVSGSLTTLASVSLAAAYGSGWYQLGVAYVGGGTWPNRTQLTLQRISDGYYLTAAGAWQSGAAVAVDSSDNSITTGGYAGLVASGATTGRVWLDDWSIASGPPAYYAIRRPNPVPRPANSPYWT